MTDTDQVSIGILVDVSQVEAAATALERLGQTGDQAGASIATLTSSSDNGTASLTVFATEAKTAAASLGSSATGGSAATGSLTEAADKTMTSLTRSASSAMASALKSVVIDGASFSDAAATLSTRLASTALTSVSSKMFDSLLTSLVGNVTGAASGSGGWLSGLFGFANGGIMTSSGPAPLHAYASGGVANEPQLALFGEGASPEAYVPLPDGRSIPVTMSGTGGGAPPVAIHMTVNAQDAASFRRSEGQIGAAVASKLQRTLQRYG
jgi:hypothetical protein